MNFDWKTALAGGIGGASVAVAIIFAAAQSGVLPNRSNDAALHDYLLSHPQILTDMASKAQADQDLAEQQEQQAAIDKLGLKRFFDPHLAYVTGPANARTSIVEFFDYNCKYCRASAPAMMKYYAQHKNDTRFAFIEFPFHGPQSTFAAQAAIAARKQGSKYIALHFALMGEDDAVDNALVLADAQKVGLDVTMLQSDMKSAGVSATIAAAQALVDSARITGTPAFIINGRIHEGVVDADILAELARR